MSRSSSTPASRGPLPTLSNRPVRERRAPDRYEPSWEPSAASSSAVPTPTGSSSSSSKGKGRPQPVARGWKGWKLVPILAEPKEVEPVPVKEEDVSDDEPIVTGRAKRRRRTGEVNQEDRQTSTALPLAAARTPDPSPTPLLTRPSSPLLLYSFDPIHSTVECTDIEELLKDMLPPPPPPPPEEVNLIDWLDDDADIVDKDDADGPKPSPFVPNTTVSSRPTGLGAKRPYAFSRPPRASSPVQPQLISCEKPDGVARTGGREGSSAKREMSWDEDGWEMGL